MTDSHQQQSIKELKRELQRLEDSLMEREEALRRKRQQSQALNTQLADERAATGAQEEARSAASTDYRNAARVKQVLEGGQNRSGQISYSSREDCVGQLMESDESRKGVESDIGELSSYIKELREKKMDAQKRLTVVRLMSMLDDLQDLLKKKVFGPNGGEEARAQELLKSIQELSRERERTLNLLSKKEREMGALIDLKQRRIEELRNESSRNACVYADSNKLEARSVAERIQAERRQLLQEIEHLEEANSRMADVLVDTKYTTQSAIKDRDEALSGDAAMGASRNPEKESKQLRERIQKANAERLVFERKTEEVQNSIDEHTAKYNARMSKLRREILFYQDESSRFEKENQNLKMLCDTLAASIDS
ncbi:elks delta-like protein [Leptomonas pyrrhocoris]|uniref:Elks delta-like protein n=1 Tax=Leptomonas pyrrhocoris TaxID=157538 RepID=A0A0N0DWL2_LEPPY|nr:elks delta-like protein [Leptomonas pyrrhocoris]XP_015660351.1 elks delta-like protein [Leptomonas pyrrhocoris]KPA81911.1 elks delta-like protein [Leptomonas pyrrhocoris]KPA81912.1 elks delta-like protein [Leptomonas pyrrhocoris]|eukprot:XP_015660350.1 elks delta-like protein [Leptomonas pyrrhocoris]